MKSIVLLEAQIQNAHERFLQASAVEVWRQVLIENANVVELEGKRYSVRITPRKGLRQVDFISTVMKFAG